MSNRGMPEPMAKRFGYAIKRAQHALRTRMDQALRPLRLTAPQYAVLAAVELDAGISNASLARAAFVTPQTMQGVLANLEREDLLARTADPAHGRILRAGLTGRGRKALAQAHRIVNEIEGAMIATGPSFAIEGTIAGGDDLTTARALYRRAVASSPDRVILWADRARILARSDRPDTMPGLIHINAAGRVPCHKF